MAHGRVTDAMCVGVGGATLVVEVCGAKSGLTECDLDVGHAGLHQATLGIGDRILDIWWAQDWVNDANIGLLHMLPSQSDEGLMPVQAFSRSADGEFHPEWYRS